jgi:hypothetical protein
MPLTITTMPLTITTMPIRITTTTPMIPVPSIVSTFFV